MGARTPPRIVGWRPRGRRGARGVVQACQTVQVNETLSIGWELEHPRVLWDGGHEIGGSSCVSCGHCIPVCPCNALMENSMLGEAGFLTGMPKESLNKMI